MNEPKVILALDPYFLTDPNRTDWRSAMHSAFDECVEEDEYTIRTADNRVVQRRLVEGDIRDIEAVWFDGYKDHADEEFCVLASVDHPDGKWAVIEASSDSTGWGCIGDRMAVVVGDREDVIRYGMSAHYRKALGYDKP